MKQKTEKKRRWWKILLVVLGVLIVLSGAELLYSNYAITVSRYAVSSEKVTASFRIVFLSALHGREFGDGNCRLIKKIADESPDLIAFVGDIFNEDADEEEITRMCSLIHAAGAIAPVYFGMGNHECSFNKTHDYSLDKEIEAAGATVLDINYLDLEINGTPVRLGGYMGYYRTPQMNTLDKAKQEEYLNFTAHFEDTDRYRILLNHITTNWVDWNCINKFSVDLVLSGHYHGGVVRIPILEKGLFAPYVGWWPPFTKGMFQGTKATCILSTGMAGSYGLPRFFNPPEICVVDVVPASS